MTQHKLVGLKNYCVQISCEEFESLKLARNKLFEALAIEDKLNLFFENYYEFEQELFNTTVRNMSHSIDSWSASIDELYSINRRLINLLTTGRLYVEQATHNIRSIYGSNSEEEKTVKNQASQEHKSDLPGYRVMYAVRNYVQHHEIPTRILNSNMRRVESTSGTFTKHTISLHIDVKFISETKGFDPKILTELQSLGESVEVMPFVRQYLSSIGKIHSKIRELLNSDLIKWEEVLYSAINQYQDITGKNEGLRVVSTGESGASEMFFLFKDFIERRRRLEDKNKYLSHYSSHFISNESPLINVE